MYWIYHISYIIIILAFCAFAWKKPGWGLVLMPFVIIGMIMAAGFTYEERLFEDCLFLFIFPLLLFPVTICIVHWTPSVSPLETPWYKAFAGVMTTIFTYIIALTLLTLVFQYLGPLLFILFSVGVVRYKLTYKYTLCLEIISAIGMSMRQSLPLPMALTTAAYGQKRKAKIVFNNIAHWLTQGYSLSESLRRGYPKCPSEILASIAAAEKMNQLPNTIEMLQADIAEKVNDYKRIRPVHPWYPILVLLVVFPIFLGLMYFIVPTFAEVLSDMSDGMAGLPWMTQKLLNSSRWLQGRHGLNMLFVSIPVLWLIFYLLRSRFRKRKPDQPTFSSQINDFLKWHLPILHWFEKNRSQLQLTEILKVGLNAGYPVNLSLRNALGLDLNYCYRSRIRKWLRRIEQGDNISESASKSGIGRTIAWAMDDSVNRGNTPVILQTLEEVYRSRYSYRLNLLNAVICPLMVIGLGVCVGFVVTAMFLPIVKIIQVML